MTAAHLAGLAGDVDRGGTGSRSEEAVVAGITSGADRIGISSAGGGGVLDPREANGTCITHLVRHRGTRLVHKFGR